MFSTSGHMMQPGYSKTATLLTNGQVLIAGGTGFSGVSLYLSSAELYDPATATFRSTGGMRDTRAEGQTAKLVNDGQALIARGSPIGTPRLNSAELDEPTARILSPTGALITGR